MQKDELTEDVEQRIPGGWFEEGDMEGKGDDGEGEETFLKKRKSLGQKNEEREVDEETFSEEDEQLEEGEQDQIQ